jgi:hypothetical protein
MDSNPLRWPPMMSRSLRKVQKEREVGRSPDGTWSPLGRGGAGKGWRVPMAGLPGWLWPPHPHPLEVCLARYWPGGWVGGKQNHSTFVEGCWESEYNQPCLLARAALLLPRNITGRLKWPVAENRLAPRCYTPAITWFHASLNCQQVKQ